MRKGAHSSFAHRTFRLAVLARARSDNRLNGVRLRERLQFALAASAELTRLPRINRELEPQSDQDFEERGTCYEAMLRFRLLQRTLDRGVRSEVGTRHGHALLEED